MALFQRFRAVPNVRPNTGDTPLDDLLTAGRFWEARDVLLQVTASGPAAADLDAASTLRLLAHCEREMAAYDAALSACAAGLAVLDRLEASGETRLERVRLLAARGQTLIEAGHVDEAEAPLQQAIELSPPNREVEGALALRSLGEISSARARHTEAEALYACAMDTLLRLLPPVHRERGHVVNSWALAALAQGWLAEAEERVRRGLELRTAMLPAGHPDIGESTHNLAGVLLKRGHLDEAEALERQALTLWEKVLGDRHPRLAVALGNLGAIAQKRSRFAEAEQFYRRTLELREAALGACHPRLIPALNNLASVQFKLGRHAEAEALFRRALDLARAARGERHPDVARALNNLHSVLNTLGGQEEGEEYLRQAIGIWEETLGPESSELATSLTNLASYQTARGENGAAESTLLRVLQIQSKRLGEDHPDLATPLNNLANLYVGEGRLDGAEQLYRRAQELRRRAGYGLSPETFANLAEIARRQGRYADQCDYLRQAIEAIEASFGAETPAGAQLRHRYYRVRGVAQRQLGDLFGARDTLRHALAIGERGRVDPADLALTLTNLGVTAFQARAPREAETAYRHGIAVLERAGNPEPARLVELLVLLGGLLVMTQRSGEAEPVLERAYALAGDALGPEHELFGAALLWLGVAALARGDAAAAERFLIGSFGQGDRGAAANASRASLALHGLRRLYRQTDRPDELTAVLENLISLRTAQGASDLQMAGLLRELGDCHFRAGRYRQAERLFARIESAGDGGFPAAFRGSTAFYRALCLAQLGDDAGANAQFAAATDALRGVDPTGHILSLAIWVEFLAVRGRVTELVERLPELAMCAEAAVFRPETTGEAYHALGMGYTRQERWANAETALRRSLAAWEDASAGESAGLNAMVVRHQLARLQVAQGRAAEAEAAFRDVITRFEAAGPAAGSALAAALLDLAGLLEQQGRVGEAADLRKRADTLG
jgi:tetratricopeptide (TPR) repeat protein